MKLKCLASGSSGNCYLLESEAETLILDVGIPIKNIKRGLDWNLKKVVGALVTHGHLDHARSVKDFEGMGMPVFKPYEDLENISADEDCRLAQKYGGFRITAFQLPHNGTRNCGFLIRADGQTILYMTDFEYCRYNFLKQKVNHILIECNYMKDLVDRDLPQYEHKIRGHCSLDYCKKFIEDNKTTALRTVLLLHMGDETCEPMECVEEVEKVANCPVYVAKKGLQVELKESECPF